MKQIALKAIPKITQGALVFLIAGMLAPAMADKPAWAGGDKSDRGDKGDKGDKGNKGNKNNKNNDGEHRGKAENNRSEHFGEQYRSHANNYYREQFRSGHCPPGLAKKNNGCMPPGQARKWTVGRPLPREVVYYTVPPTLVVQFGQPPSGHRYARAASDIIRIATGTGMVVEALQDLGR